MILKLTFIEHTVYLALFLTLRSTTSPNTSRAYEEGTVETNAYTVYKVKEILNGFSQATYLGSGKDKTQAQAWATHFTTIARHHTAFPVHKALFFLKIRHKYKIILYRLSQNHEDY